MTIRFTGKYSTPLRTWWDWHPDRCPNDFGPPQRSESDEERHEWIREKYGDMTEDEVLSKYNEMLESGEITEEEITY